MRAYWGLHFHFFRNLSIITAVGCISYYFNRPISTVLPGIYKSMDLQISDCESWLMWSWFVWTDLEKKSKIRSKLSVPYLVVCASSHSQIFWQTMSTLFFNEEGGRGEGVWMRTMPLPLRTSSLISLLTANNETKINLVDVHSMNPSMSGFSVRCLVFVETNAGCSMDKSYNSIQGS